jgi:apolipoprotein N-acyltransferase
MVRSGHDPDGLRLGRIPVRRTTLVYGLSVAGGFLFVQAHHSPDLGWAGWFSLLPLLLAARILPALAAAAAGSAWGAGAATFEAAAGVTSEPSGTALTFLAVLPALC